MSSCARSTEKNFCMLSSGITPDLGIDKDGYCVDEINCLEYLDRYEHDSDEEPELASGHNPRMGFLPQT